MAVKYLVSGKSGDHLPVSKADGSPDHRLMGAAWAALHGGYRGKEYAGPDKDKAISKLKAMYKAEKMDTPSESWARKGSSLQEADIVANSQDSYDAVRCSISDQINDNVRNGIDMDCDDDGPEDVYNYAYVMDVFPQYAVYSMEGNTFMVQWHRNANGQIVLGEPFPVQQSWTTVDSPVMDDEEQEAHRLLVAHVEQLREAAYDRTKGEVTLRVIQPGFNKSKSRFYPSETLKRDFKVFKGAKMFVDHQTEAQEKAQPEGSVNNWVATLNNVWCEEDGTIMGTAAVIDPTFKAKLDTLAEKNLLTDMGVSIRAIGEATVMEGDGGHEYRNVDSFLAARSVDFVTFAGAGGAVLAIESSSLVNETDVDLVTVAELRKRRPDLIKAIQSSALKESGTVKTIEQQLKEAQEALSAANAKVAALEKTAKVSEANAELTKLLSESKLPEVAVNRIKKQFKDATSTEGMKEAIDAEAEYIKSLAPVKKNNGADDNGSVVEADQAKVTANLIESYQSLGLTKEQAEIAAKR